MIKSIINGSVVTPTQLAKEIVHQYGEYSVSALGKILGAHGNTLTDREFDLVSQQVVKILARVAKHLNHDLIEFHEDAALKHIQDNKGKTHG